MAQEFHFHHNHGKDIRLSEDRLTAWSKGDRYKGIVVSSEEMAPEILYEVVVEENDQNSGNIMPVGVTKNPKNLSIPDSPNRWRNAIVIFGDTVQTRGDESELPPSLKKKLENLPVGSRVGLAIDGARNLHLFINNTDQGVAAQKVPQPWHALFCVWCSYKQVRALPMRAANFE